ncbi:MAG TPA: hypothetical protein DGG95_17650, partial [Cytophagales bacterium]|nr:hypothetical protein [Cytophagales bacterium]
ATTTVLLKFQDGKIIIWDESTGLPSKTLNYRCIYQNLEGRLWVGTGDGVAFTQRNDLLLGTTPKPVFLSIKINGKEIKETNPEKWYPSSSYLEATFLSFSFPNNKMLYQSRLGDNGTWSEPSPKTEITFPKLKSGKNVVQVRARNIAGYAWSEVASFQFNVKEAWYVKWWAILIYLSAAGFLFWGIVLYKSKRLIAEKRRLEKIIDERTKEIVEKNSIINEQNSKLKDINQNLEQKVNEQTKLVWQSYKKLLVAHNDLDTFVYRSSHDLRGPIARLLGLCHLAILEVTDKKSLEYITRLEQTSLEMDILLNRLLRTQEIKSKEVVAEPVHVSEAIKQIINRLLPLYAELKTKLNINVPDTIVLHSDPLLFNILIENLLKNAFQFTDISKPNSYIRIEANLIDGLSLQLSIADNGLGIPAQVKKRLFELLFKASNDKEAAGLGLYEAKIISEKLGGSIEFNDGNNQETEFIITIPLAATVAQELPNYAPIT